MANAKRNRAQNDSADRKPAAANRIANRIANQGQRTLNSFDTKDLHQEVIIPAAELAFHGEAFFAGVLLQE